MAARKLQTEVDRTFKKIDEGVEQFVGIYEKMQAATNQAQKEKLENDLKTQIKKLQRMRDQIKVWAQSNDIKDKQPLFDYRKLIETQMERFKATEKEMKTKAFSRAGLDAAAKLDPKEIVKRDMADWVSTMQDDLNRQIEQSEAEVEGLQGAGRKKKDQKATTRIAELEGANDRRKWHVSRLDIVLRMLENGTIDPEALSTSSFQDDVKYYVESNTEEDFDEDTGIYDDLHLDEEEEAFGMNQDDVVSSHDSTSVADASDLVPQKTPAKEPVGGQKRSASGSLPSADESPSNKKPGRKPTLDSTTARPVIPTTVKPTPVSSAAPAPTPAVKPIQTAPLRYASAAAGALAPLAAPASAVGSAPSPPSVPAVPAIATTSAAAAQPITSPTASATGRNVRSPPSIPLAQPTAAPLSESPSNVISPTQLNGLPVSAPLVPPGLGAPSPPAGAASVPAVAGPSSFASPASSAPIGLPTPPPGSDKAPTPQPVVHAVLPAAPSLTPGPRPSSTQPSETSSASKVPPPSSLADLVSTFESAKGKALRNDADLSAIHQILESGYSNVPQAADADKPKYYVPRMPHQTPSVYPSTPLPHLETPALFTKLDLDTLFYVFYYFPGTFYQYLAAQELKKQSWRFHRQYLTWFQRANEPTVITDEYEQGVYLYFDWESAWSTRRKNSFTFYYQWCLDFCLQRNDVLIICTVWSEDLRVSTAVLRGARSDRMCNSYCCASERQSWEAQN